MNNRVQLNIAGVTIVVSSPEDDSYVERIAETVNQDMQMLLRETKASVTSAALLLAVDYMDRYQKSNRSASNMRTQIKGYLADAAGAKLLFDEEKKRSDAFAAENEELKARLEQFMQTATAGPKREDLDAVGKKLQSMNDQLRTQNEYIARQDDEIKRLHSEQAEHLDRVGLQSEQISALELSLQQKQEEISRLLNELKTLEEMITEDISSESRITERRETRPVPNPEKKELPRAAGVFDSLPPLYRPDPSSDASYDIDSMPNLNWTDNI